VSTILSNGFPGEQVGPAVADIVFGEVSPQAKLPVTFPNKENEQGMTEEQYPGLPNTEFELQCVYSEGQINGYRWYDKNNVAPAFAFGHGLTYGGQFEYSDLVVADRTITFTVKRDSATLSGCDTPQIYFSFPSAEKDSVRSCCRWRRVFLSPRSCADHNNMRTLCALNRLSLPSNCATSKRCATTSLPVPRSRRRSPTSLGTMPSPTGTWTQRNGQ